MGRRARSCRATRSSTCWCTLREQGLTRVETSPAADRAWCEHVAELVAPSLFVKADSWYMGANIPGKPREMLSYPGGLPAYLQKWQECKNDGYSGFVLG